MLKYTGIIRQIDSMGRLVLPRELRRLLDIEDGRDHVEFFVDENKTLVVRKYQPACHFCNSMTNLVHFAQKRVCKVCIDKLETLKDITPDDDLY